MRLRNSFYLLALFVLASCAQAQLASHVAKQFPTNREERVAKAKGRFKVGNPYRIKGKKYTPKETYRYSKTGIASWYGPGFDGKMTANGEIFNQNELTAAHKTLQMPSLVRVTNLSNGRSIVVRVNDRGPYAHGRLIDVSKRAAELLGFKSKGTAKVRVDLLPEESQAVAIAAKNGISTRGSEIAANENRTHIYQKPTPQVRSIEKPRVINETPEFIQGDFETGEFIPDPVIVKKPAPQSADIFIQAGSFANAMNAENLAAQLRRYHTTAVQEVPVYGKTFYRVRVGPVSSVDKADALLAELVSNGYRTAKIVID